MVFSLFGKKSPPAKPAARKPVSRPAAPAARPSEPPRAVAKPIDDDKQSLDFTALSSFSENSSFGAAQIQLSDVGAMPQAIEEAAMLYANDQAAAACAVLEAAVKGRELGGAIERGWGMLFDLYQALNQREDYEALALDYAAQFEKSPPAWREADSVAGPGGGHGGSRAFVALTGKVTTQSAEPMKQMLRMAETNPTVRLDATRVQSVDNGGAALLLKALQLLKKQHKTCDINGASHLAGLVRQGVAAGRRDAEESWLLLLDLMQREGDQGAFEDLAVEYAVTFEVSPPSWEPPPAKPAKVTTAVATEGAESAFPLLGDVVAAGTEFFAPLITFANEHSEVTIDASGLRRIDFVSAGQLLNAVSRLQMAGKHVLICGVSHLVMSLFEIIGIGQLAELRLRRA